MLSIILYREVSTLKTKIYQGDYQKERTEEEKKAMLREMDQLANLLQDDAQNHLKTEKMIVKEDKHQSVQSSLYKVLEIYKNCVLLISNPTY